jgi:hypothetical protein
MNTQLPAEGILLQRDYGNAKTYKIACECGCGDSDHQIWVEAEDTGVSVTTYTMQKTKFWDVSRWRLIWTLLTRGYVEYDAAIMMTRQQALNYAAVLNSAVIDVEEFRKARKK